MINSKYARLPFLPETRLERVDEGVTLSHPLSRRGFGPGFIVVVPSTGTADGGTLAVKGGVPSPLMKWAEEGFTVVEITEAALENVKDVISRACAALATCKSTRPADGSKPIDGVGLVAYTPKLWNRVAGQLSATSAVVGAAVYGDLGSASDLTASPLPVVQHLAGKSAGLLPRTPELTVYDYPSVTSPLFSVPFQSEFDYTAESVSHTRNLTFFKNLLGGPYFDLEALWDEHTYYEFENRSLECTMGTMVQEPYVNHVPTVS
jgi:carboxymethylenebutenolidase